MSKEGKISMNEFKMVVEGFQNQLGLVVENMNHRFDRLDAEMGGMKTEQNKMRMDIQVLKHDVGTLKSDVGVLKSDVGVLKSDVAVLKSDVAVLKSDVAVLKTDVGVLKNDMVGVKEQIALLHVGQTGIRTDIREIRSELHDMNLRVTRLEERTA